MAGPGGKFFIEDNLNIKAKHHESFEQLWETKWKQPVGLQYMPSWLSIVHTHLD